MSEQAVTSPAIAAIAMSLRSDIKPLGLWCGWGPTPELKGFFISRNVTFVSSYVTSVQKSVGFVTSTIAFLHIRVQIVPICPQTSREHCGVPSAYADDSRPPRFRG